MKTFYLIGFREIKQVHLPDYTNFEVVLIK